MDGEIHELAVSAIDHEVGASPAFYVGRVFGHVLPATLEDMGFDTRFDELRLLVERRP